MFKSRLEFCAFPILLLSLASEAVQANTTTSSIIIPKPPGPYLTEFKIQVLVDKSRPDPFSSSEQCRRVLASVFTPVPKSDCHKFCEVQYMPPITAADEDAAIGTIEPLFERFKLSGICCDDSSEHKASHKPPLVIWSPGFGESRTIWSASAQYLSSYGYEVILVDHPGDARIAEFPDGKVVRSDFGSNSSDELRVFALNVEVQDVLFVLDSYSKGNNGACRKYGYDNKVGVIAHGAIAAQAMLNDSLKGHPGRIAGGVNLDGRFEGPALTEGLGPGIKSSLLWAPASGPNNITNWDEWWNITKELDPRDWQSELCIANSTQGTFSDLPLLADVSGLRKSEPKAVDLLLGTINGVRSTSILTTYNAAFFDMTLKGKKETLLNGPSAAYPEVRFARSSA